MTRDRHSNKFYRLAIAFGVVVAVAVAPTRAQTQEPDSAPEDAAQSITTPLIETLEAQIAKVEARTDLDEKLRNRIAATYREAAEARRAAEGYRLKAERVDQLRKEAPENEAALRFELSEADPYSGAAAAAASRSADEVDQRVEELQAELLTQRTALLKLEGEFNHRAERRTTLPREESDARLAAQELRGELGGLPADGDEALQARRALLAARIEEAERKAELYSKELLSYDARRGLLTSRRDLAAQRVKRLERALNIWRSARAGAREAQASQASREARDVRDQIGKADPTLQKLADEIVALAEERSSPTGVAVKLSDIEAKLAERRALAASLRERFDSLRSKATIVGYTNAIGALLRKERQNLPAFSARDARSRQTEIADVQYRLIQLEETADELSDLDPQVEKLTARVISRMSTRGREQVEINVRGLLESKRQYIDSLLENYEAYFHALVELDNVESSLIQETEAYAGYINEHVLWIRDTRALSPTDIPAAFDAAVWLVHPRSWQGVATSLWETFAEHTFAVAATTLLLSALFYYQAPLRRLIRDTGRRSRDARITTLSDSAWALGATFLTALAWPALMNFLSYMIGVDHRGGPTSFAPSLSMGLAQVATMWLSFEFLRQLCRQDGIAETQLAWNASRIETIRWHTPWALGLAAGPLLIAFTLQTHAVAEWQSSLGRLGFIAATGVLALYTYRILAPTNTGTTAAASLQRSSATFLQVVATAVPIALAILAASGWYFSALQLASHIPATNWLIVLLLVADGLILRWLRLAEFHLRQEQARAALAEAREREKRKSGDALVEQTEATAELPDIAAVSAQTRQLVRVVLGAVMIAGLYAIWAPVLPALRLFDRFELWTVGDGHIITLGSVLLALLIFVAAAVAARNIPALLEIVLFQRLPLQPGVRYAARALSRYVIIITGTVIGFGALGIAWTDVQWLAAAMTVGLGFGLQEIFANFVSGIILLFERPMRVGDTVTLGTTTGTVTRIHTRATTITDFDRKELIVPNKEFITGQLINWTLSDNVLRIVIPVGVAYGSDVALTEATLLRVAKACPQALTNPEPSVLFESFGESSLNFQLRVFIASFEHWLRTRHSLNKSIDAAFREAGIEISFPQRDLHVRSIDIPIPVSRAALEEEREDDTDAEP